MAYTLLQGDLADAGRADDAVRISLALADAAQKRLLFAERALYHAAIVEIGRDNFDAADAILKRMEGLQARDHKGNWAAPQAIERSHRCVAHARLFLARGLLDLADAQLDRARERYLQGFPGDEANLSGSKLREKRNLAAKIGRVELDVLLGAGRLERVLLRGTKLVAELTESDVRDAASRRRVLERPMAAAMHLIALRDPARSADALMAQRRVLEDPDTGVGERFEAAALAADLLLVAEDMDAADDMARRAAALARVPAELAEAMALEGRITLARGGPLPATFHDQWDAVYEGFLAHWEGGQAADSGTSFLQFERRRMLVHAGIRFALSPGGGGAGRAFERFLASERLGSLARRLRARGGADAPRNLADVRERCLAPGEGYLAPLLSWYGSYAIVVTGDELQFIEAPPLWEFSAELRSLRRSLAGAGFSTESRADRRTQLASDGDALGAALLSADVMAALGNVSLLTVVEGGAAGSLPLHLARTADGALGERVPCAWIPSFAAESALTVGDPKGTSPSVGLVANVAVQGLALSGVTTSLESVELDPARLESIVADFSQAATILSGDEGAESKLKAGALAEHRVGEVIAHGWQAFDGGRPASVVLGDTAGGDGLWRCQEVEASSLPPVMVLATCRAGYGPERTGDAFASDLAGACLLAGSRVVLSARGDLPLDATVEFLREFNHALSLGNTVAEAAHGARAALREMERFDDPFHYAQLLVVGCGEYRPFPEAPGALRTRRWGAVGLGALLAAGLALFLARRTKAAASFARP